MATAKTILEVSYKLFVEKGYEATNIREICKEVGVGMPAIYYHFQSKENLFYKAYDEYASMYFEQYENRKIIYDDVNAEVKLFTLFKEDMKYITANETHFRFHIRYMFFPPKELSDELEKKRLMYENRRDNIIMKVIQQGIEEGAFDKYNLDNFLKSYKKFVLDNMIGAVFLKSDIQDSVLEASWKSFMEYNNVRQKINNI